MAEDTPRPERPARDRGRRAGHAGDPTRASYLSSLYYLVSVPAFVVAAHAGYWAGWYGYDGVLPAFAGLLIASVGAAFWLMSRR